MSVEVDGRRIHHDLKQATLQEILHRPKNPRTVCLAQSCSRTIDIKCHHRSNYPAVRHCHDPLDQLKRVTLTADNPNFYRFKDHLYLATWGVVFLVS